MNREIFVSFLESGKPINLIGIENTNVLARPDLKNVRREIRVSGLFVNKEYGNPLRIAESFIAFDEDKKWTPIGGFDNHGVFVYSADKIEIVIDRFIKVKLINPADWDQFPVKKMKVKLRIKLSLLIDIVAATITLKEFKFVAGKSEAEIAFIKMLEKMNLLTGAVVQIYDSVNSPSLETKP